MTSIELLDIIGVGETSKVQFKREFDNQDKIAAEMIAFSNSKGGMLLFGVEDKSIKLGNAAVRNNLITSFCSKLMSYRGFGSGIIRAVESQPNIEMENDEKGEQFTIRVFRDENLESSEENVATSISNLESSCTKIKKRVSRQKMEELIVKESREYISVEDLALKIQRDYFYLINEIIPRMVKDGKLERLYPDTPNHPKQKYRTKI